jgi:hypothetical protein
MKTLNYILALILTTALISCEEVIDIDLSTAPPRLVVEASINWDKGTIGNEQFVKLTTTTDYFSSTIPTVSGATVFITNSSNVTFDFIEGTEPGIYECSDFVPVINETYVLTILHDGEIYTSTEKLLKTPEIKRIEQNDEAGVLGDDTEVRFVYDDIPNETNYYLQQIDDPYKAIPEFGILEDRFFQNNEMFGLYFINEFVPGDVLTFTLNGVSQNFYNYYNILLAQAGTTSAGPFSTPTSTVRGNVVNQTNFDNYALGYFRLSERTKVSYTIE